MVQFFLKKNDGFCWYNTTHIFIKGCFYDEVNNYYEKNEMLSFFQNVDNQQQFLQKVKSINGVFTVLIKIDDQVYVASDTSRIFPIFYTFQNNNLCLSDDAKYLKNQFHLNEVDKYAEQEFLTCQYITQNKTLFKNLYQNQSNQILFFKSDQLINESFFYSYAIKKHNDSNEQKMKNDILSSFENGFKRLVKSIGEKQIVLPLSGGYDSRLIAVMLKKYNCQNVICYTYGKKDSFEIKNSKKTAETLGFKWLFIEYDDNLINNFLKTETFKNYIDYTGHLSTMPFLQEYFSVKYLKENSKIENNAVFVPGHCGDFLGGSQYLSLLPEKMSIKNIEETIFKKRYKHCSFNKAFKQKTLDNTSVYLKRIDTHYHQKSAHSVFEDFDLKELFSKFLFNSSNVYNYFGYEHRFPFWDLEILNSFRNLPINYKEGKIFYDTILHEEFFEKYNVAFEFNKSFHKKNELLKTIKKKIKYLIPYAIIERKLKKHDYLNYSLMTQLMRNDLIENNIKPRKKVNQFNDRIVEWYINYAKEKLS